MNPTSGSSESQGIWTRRAFEAAAADSAAIGAEPEAQTVRGLVPIDRLGVTLAHEHLFSRFFAEPAEPPSYDEEKLLATVVPIAKRVKSLGADSIADCTAAYFGLSPRLLRAISEASGLHVVQAALRRRLAASAEGTHLPLLTSCPRPASGYAENSHATTERE